MLLIEVRAKLEVVKLALRKMVVSRKRPDLRNLFGSDLIADDYDYKEARAGRSFILTGTSSTSPGWSHVSSWST